MNLKAIQARIRSDSKLLPGKRSFLLKPKAKPKASVLLLHGFSASPWEVRECGLMLQKKGYMVYAPRIAGHGAGRADFDSHGEAEWMATAEQAYAELYEAGKKMILIGHSAGGVLATRLAALHQSQIRCLALGAPAFHLADPMAPFSRIPLVRFFRPALHFKMAMPDAQYWTLDYASSRVAELVRAGLKGQEAALKLSLPLLLMQARGDGLVSSRFNEALFLKIPSQHKSLMIYEAQEHNVFYRSNPLQRQVFGKLSAFLSHPQEFS